MNAPLELRTADDAERWFCASLALIRAAPLSDAEEAGPWVQAALAERPHLPPVGVVADVGLVATGAPLSGAAPFDVAPPLRAALQAYEDHLLARLAADPRLDAIRDALASLSPAVRADAVALLATQLFDRLEVTHTAGLSPAVARRLLSRKVRDLADAGRAALLSPALSEKLAAAYDELARAARRTRTLLGEADVFALESFEALRGLSNRLAARQVLEAGEAFERVLPWRVKATSARGAHAVTRADDEAAWPSGGFAALSTAGSFENLVTSELAYMEDGPDLDLFDVRYVEGELLYYARDESLRVRRRRSIHFVLAPSLVAARFKDPRLPWQRLVVVLAALFAVTRRLVAWLSDDALEIRFVFVGDALEPERSLAEVLLRGWVSRGIVEVSSARAVEDAIGQMAERARQAQTELVLVDGTDEPCPLELEASVRRVILRATSRPSLEGISPVDELSRPAAWEAWTEAASALLAWLV